MTSQNTPAPTEKGDGLLHLTIAENVLAALVEEVLAALVEEVPALDAYDEDEMAALETIVAMSVRSDLDAMIAATQQAAPVSLPAREEVARVIHPWAFDTERHVGVFDRTSSAEYRGYALAKADAILSLIKGDGR